MEWLTVLLSALTATLVSAAPAVYRLLWGRAQSLRADHQQVFVELHKEITRLTSRLDARIAQAEGLHERLLTAEKHLAECETRSADLRREIERLKNSVQVAGPDSPIKTA